MSNINQLTNQINAKDGICVIRFACTKENVAKLNDVVKNLLSEADAFTPPKDIVVKTFVYNGDSTTSEALYKKNIIARSSFGFSTSQLHDMSLKNFTQLPDNRKILLLEPTFDNTDDGTLNVIYFQYIVLILNYLEQRCIRYGVYICANQIQNLYYPSLSLFRAPIQLAVFMYYCSPEILAKIYIHQYNGKKSDWVSLLTTTQQHDKLSEQFGKIFPLIQIDSDAYLSLTNCTYSTSSSTNQWVRNFKALCNRYIDLYLKNKYDNVSKRFYKLIFAPPGQDSDDLVEYIRAQENFKQDLDRLRATTSEEDSPNLFAALFFRCFGIKRVAYDNHLTSILNEFSLKHSTSISNLRAQLLERENITEFLKHDSLLESLLFLSTLCYLVRTKSDKKSKNEKQECSSKQLNIIELHETCVDYAQGISQLLENVLYHVINADHGTNEGTGVFAIRVRTRDDFLKHQQNNTGTDKSSHFDNTFIADVKFFMEIYVTDYKYNDEKFKTIVQKFVDNMLEYSADQGIDATTTISENDIELAHVFGEDAKYKPYRDSYMAKYYSQTTTIAHHYGLQILNSVIQTSNGYLFVRSGQGDRNCFSKGDNYKHQKFGWGNGTSYIIYLPIKEEQAKVDYSDVISALTGNSADGSHPEYKPLNIDALVTKIATSKIKTAREKVSLIQQIVVALKTQVTTSEHNDVYYIVDLKNKTLTISMSEILSKAFFILLVDNVFDNLAIVNIQNRHDVIRIFRQFALFYNRSGYNYLMNEKSVYLVDETVKLDILLYGNNLKSIKDNLLQSKIYGGYDEVAMQIVNHLAQGR